MHLCCNEKSHVCKRKLWSRPVCPRTWSKCVDVQTFFVLALALLSIWLRRSNMQIIPLGTVGELLQTWGGFCCNVCSPSNITRCWALAAKALLFYASRSLRKWFHTAAFCMIIYWIGAQRLLATPAYLSLQPRPQRACPWSEYTTETTCSLPPATAPSAIFVDGLAQGSASPCRSAVHHWSSDAAKHNGSWQLCGDIRHMCNCIHKWFHTATYFCTSCRLDLHHCFLFAVALQCVHARENDIKLTFFESNLCATSGRCRMLPNSISNLFDGW